MCVKNVKLFLFVFTTTLLLILFSVLTSFHASDAFNFSSSEGTGAINISVDLPLSPKIKKDQKDFNAYKIWRERIRKELLKPNTVLSKKSFNEIQDTNKLLESAIQNKAFYVTKKSPVERIEIFQQKLNNSKELRSLFLHMMWSMLSKVVVDELGAKLIFAEAKINQKTHSQRKYVFPKREKTLTVPSKEQKNIIIADTPSSCADVNSNYILYLDPANLNKQCLGFRNIKKFKKGFYAEYWWNNHYYTEWTKSYSIKTFKYKLFEDRSKFLSLPIDPPSKPFAPNSEFYVNHKNIFKDGDDYLAVALDVHLIVKKLWEQFLSSGTTFADWKMDLTKLPGRFRDDLINEVQVADVEITESGYSIKQRDLTKALSSREQLIHLLDKEGNLRSGIKENVLENVNARWGELFFLDNTLWEKMKIFEDKNVLWHEKGIIRYYSLLKDAFKTEKVGFSNSIPGIINRSLNHLLYTLQKADGFGLPSEHLSILQPDGTRLDVSSLVVSKAPNAFSLTLPNLKILGKIFQIAPNLPGVRRSKLVSGKLEKSTHNRLNTIVLNWIQPKLDSYKTKIQSILQKFANSKIKKIVINGTTYQVEFLLLWFFLQDTNSQLSDSQLLIAKQQLLALARVNITPEELTKALEDAAKITPKNKGLIIGLSVTGGVLFLSALGGSLFWFFKIKK